jgi:thiamine-phosphate pyrophosphorylase
MFAARGLYAIVDPSACRGRDPERIAAAVLRGGCAILQLRMKNANDRDTLALARRIRALCAASGVPFVMNDRPDLAVLAQADGVHVGQGDLPIAELRRIVGPSVIVGRSTHDEAQVTAAVDEGAQIVAFGPIFATASKERPDPVVGIDRLGAVCARCPLPVVAIGGIDLSRAEAVRAAGARLGAAIGAICGADEPELAARELHRALGGTA